MPSMCGSVRVRIRVGCLLLHYAMWAVCGAVQNLSRICVSSTTAIFEGVTLWSQSLLLWASPALTLERVSCPAVTFLRLSHCWCSSR